MKSIRSVFFLMGILFLAGCATSSLEPEQATATVEKLIMAIDASDYEEMKKYYTDHFNESEPEETRRLKYDQLRQAFGPVESYELIETLQNNEFGEVAALDLTYRIIHQNLTTLEKFEVIIEDGVYKVAAHDIRNE